MDRNVIPGDCAKLLNQLVHLWQRNNCYLEPPTPPLDTDVTGVLQELVKVLALEQENQPAPSASLKKLTGNVPIKLTPRERDVLYWLAKGKSVSDVSELMQISKCTVRTYIQRTLKKLDVSNRTHAVTRALRFGLIEL